MIVGDDIDCRADARFVVVCAGAMRHVRLILGVLREGWREAKTLLLHSLARRAPEGRGG